MLTEIPHYKRMTICDSQIIAFINKQFKAIKQKNSFITPQLPKTPLYKKKR